ncbi:uncharacterized protein CELE_R07G3.7 [Caenorhabditis elegans]|uniref:Uncharacterized protein R07G3.7 n=2 Tax=Caenorhabditis elegans TaxID=6239 RepID=YRO7_CAEEL|nr:Uncharacterized protein CELE_R07G3.7 [Caenorhabditis elegans]Q09424.2 RecName: Full=Uncharacterized protein R07G3.7 [Caenorhabditis elegans]CCD70518.1 Uncharacterized protein CELE_R07G3.7 [Caenorhabditis elegans]|eukprot:NP_495597.2 Uncharacterized protein CELE_R07G3.7 [Caenorhabditis elegans]
MASSKKQKKKMHRPHNRKLMIRDLPVGAAYLLHPSLRGILLSRPKRWNSGSPSHRIAVNLVRKYKKQLKPRVLPFFCDHCRLASRTLLHIKEHVCDKEEKRKAARKEESRKFADYDVTNEIKLATNSEKQWRFNAMAVLEQTLRPNKVAPKKVEIEEDPGIDQLLDSEPDQEFYDAQEQEFEDDTPHYPIKDVLVPSSQPPRPKVTLKSSECLGHNDAGVFCFNCKGSFDSYNQFQLHLNEDYNDGKCNRALPEYYYVQRHDRTHMFDKRYKHSVQHHKPIKRDISHIQCTLCKAVNFASTGDLYAHMVKCASSTTNEDKESAIDCPTAFGYGMPPSFNACQYVFPDPAKERYSRNSRGSKEPVES